MRTLAGWCVRHRRIVVLLWIAVLVVSIFSVEAAGTNYSNNFSFPHTQSFDAINLLKSVAPSHSGDQEQVVFGTTGDAKLTDPAIGQRVNAMVAKINALPNVTEVTSPFDENGNLIGIVESTLNPLTMAKVEGEIPQNVNYAVKSSYILPLLDDVQNLPPSLVSPAGAKFEDTVSNVQKSVVLILVY